jgi:hypothetical protein
VYIESDIFAHESGLLAVVVMGLVMGNLNLPNLKELLYFKESLSVLLISILFILLAAHINLEDLQLIYSWKTAVLFAIIVFLIRPVGVFLSAQGSDLKFNEKVFISWVGPRGIVAAGIASLFGSKLIARGEPGAEFITPLVFTIVLGTVLLNATTARPFAKLIGVFLTKSEGILIVGASKASRLIGRYLQRNNRHVVLIDSNQSNIDKAQKAGLEAISANIYADNLTDNIELNDVGYLIAMTANPEINQYAIEKFQEEFGENGSFRIVGTEEINNPENADNNKLFSTTDDFVRFVEAVRMSPAIREIALKDSKHYTELAEKANDNLGIVPLFLKSPDGELHIIPSFFRDSGKITEGYKLVYLGNSLSDTAEKEAEKVLTLPAGAS